MNRKRLTEDGIRNAIRGEPNAVRRVLTYYSGYMTTLATRSVCDADGSRKYSIDIPQPKWSHIIIHEILSVYEMCRIC